MFDGLTKSKFYIKCKSSIKMTRTRLEALKKKKKAVAKYLKNDMADLLRIGLDYNAYNRAEGLLIEQNMIACYDFIEQFCECISTNLSAMNKQKECPEECKGAVQSLIYAAARFSEFPELRDLRTLFTERYGNCLEPYINKEFVEKLRPKPATKEMKLQLMHGISQEFSIEWSSKSLEQSLFVPPAPQPDQYWHKPLNNADGYGFNQKKINDHTIQEKDMGDDHDDGYRWRLNKDGQKQNEMSQHIVSKRHERELQSSEDKVSPAPGTECTDQDKLQASSSSVGSDPDQDEVNIKKPFLYGLVPPPYLKPKVDKEDTNTEKPLRSSNSFTADKETDDQDDSFGETKPKPRSVRRKPLKPPPGHENEGNIERPLRPPPPCETVGKFGRQLKPPPGREISGNERDGSSATKQEAATTWSRLLQTEDNDDDKYRNDEEEKIIDGLLMHYSKKESPYKQKKALDSSHLKPSPQQASDEMGGDTRRRSTKSDSELPLPPGRVEASRRHARAVSVQPEMLVGNHVHPNLPDYDELAARIAALKGT